MSTQRSILAAGSLILSVGLTVQPAFAQSEGETTRLDKIVVEGSDESALENVEGYAAKAASTGTRGLPGDLTTTPRSISVVTSKQATDQGAASMEEAISYTPGVTVQTYGNDGRYDQLAIRGFEILTTGDYRDGMPLRLFGWGGWRSELFGVERLEVLRGPTASLYGSNEPGGLVNSITKRPQFEKSIKTMVQTSAFGGGKVGVDITGPLSDILAYRLVGLVGKNGTNYDGIDESRQYFAPSLTWTPTADTNLTIFGQYQKDEVGDTYVLVPLYGSKLPNPLGKYDNDFYTGNINRSSTETEQNYIGYEFDNQFENGLTFRSRARYAVNDWDNQTAYAANFFSSAVLAALPPVSGGIDAATLYNFDVDQTTKQLTFDNGLQADVAFGNVTGTVIGGIDYYRGQYDNIYSFGYGGTHFLQTGVIVNLPGYPTAPIPYTAKQDINQTGLYFLGDFKIGNNIVVNAGLRHDWLDIEGTSSIAGVSQSLANRKNFSSGNFGASYNFDNGFTVYGAISRSFNLPPAAVSSTGQPLEVEMADSYEIGARFRPAGSNSLISVGLFDITKTNAQQAVPGFPGMFDQVGEVNSRGVEVEANYNFDNGFSILAGYTYIDAKITKNTTNQGNRLARVPEHAATIWANYEVPKWEGLRLGVGARYTGERFSDNANTAAYKMDDVTVFDASVSYASSGWTTTLAARNLADTRYVTFCHLGDTTTLPPGANAAQASGCSYGTGRTIALSLTRKF